MSLINEALKKAQRQRTAENPMDAPPVPGGGKIVKRGQARSANSMVLIGSGAVALIVLSVVATVFLLNRRPSTPPAPPVAAKAPSTTPVLSAPVITVPSILPPVVAPVIPTATEKLAPPVVTENPAPAPPVSNPPVATAPSPKSVPTPAPPAVVPTRPATSSAPVATTPTATAPVPALPPASTASTSPAPAAAPAPVVPAANAKPDDRVTAFVEAIRVTGIRSSGADSRVLMNDRVYRVNDVVDRTLNIKLIAVAVDSLTFADPNGLVYIKHF